VYDRSPAGFEATIALRDATIGSGDLEFIESARVASGTTLANGGSATVSAGCLSFRPSWTTLVLVGGVITAEASAANCSRN
jgi:autotransporter passenger strand-loop-strand repeat protein